MTEPWTCRTVSSRALTTAGLTALALPGAAVGLWVALIQSAPFFGEQPDADDMLLSTLALWSAASVCVLAALCLVANGARLAWLVPVLPAALLAAAALTNDDRIDSVPASGAPGVTAGDVGSAVGAAWVVPTSWALVVVLVVAVVRRVRARA